MSWDKLADRKIVEKTMASLKQNGIDAYFVETGEEAKKKVLEMLPAGAEVMTMTSMTNETIGLAKEINQSGRFNPIRDKLYSMDSNTKGAEMRRLDAAQDFAVGSVNAVTEDGHVIIASATGSQLPAYAYGAGKVIWVVGTQKIVTNMDEGMKRIREYTFPLEDARARKAYGVGSGINKTLVISKEYSPGRITLIFVNEVLGF